MLATPERIALIRTLHRYIGSQLAKVSGLALLAFTLMMTVFAIIEPLRKYGLGADKALGLIGFTLPMMMSLTFPIAALFAATIVYGRFGQDNEMLACRASGISTLSVLTPALALGAVVTIISLMLNSFITPQIARSVETAIKANVRSYAYQMLRSHSGVRWRGKGWIVHADRIDEEKDRIEGLVVTRPLNRSKGNGDGGDEVQLVAAPKGLVNFTEEGGETWLTFFLVDAAVASTEEGQYSVVESTVQPPFPIKVPSFVEEDPSWYSWPKLIRTLRNPTESSEVRGILSSIRTRLCYEMLAKEIVSTVSRGGTYMDLADYSGGTAYYIRAGEAKMAGQGTVQLRSGKQGESLIPVEIAVIRQGRPYQIITAEAGLVRAKPSEVSLNSFVTIELPEGAEVRNLDQNGDAIQYRQSWSMGQLPIPSHFLDSARSIPLDDICRRTEELTGDQKTIRKITDLKDATIRRLMNKVKTEMHMRAAYSLSCLFMVAMGAALGLLLRGGQVISAFAISVVPASLVIVMMMMGKQMAKNPHVSISWGLAMIWMGVLLLLAADAAIYFYLSRR